MCGFNLCSCSFSRIRSPTRTATQASSSGSSRGSMTATGRGKRHRRRRRRQRPRQRLLPPARSGPIPLRLRHKRRRHKRRRGLERLAPTRLRRRPSRRRWRRWQLTRLPPPPPRRRGPRIRLARRLGRLGVQAGGFCWLGLCCLAMACTRVGSRAQACASGGAQPAWARSWCARTALCELALLRWLGRSPAIAQSPRASLRHHCGTTWVAERGNDSVAAPARQLTLPPCGVFFPSGSSVALPGLIDSPRPDDHFRRCCRRGCRGGAEAESVHRCRGGHSRGRSPGCCRKNPN